MARARCIDRLVKSHDDFFGSEAAMMQANPQLILERVQSERGARISLPPLLVLQGTNDDNVTPDMAAKLAAAWRAAGGSATLEFFDGMPHAFVTREPETTHARRAIKLVVDFVRSRGAAA